MKRSEWTAGDDNVARLLRQPFDPPLVSADFAQRVQARLQDVAAEMARKRSPSPPRAFNRQRWSALAGVAAVLGLVALGLHWMPRLDSSSAKHHSANEPRFTAAANPSATRIGKLEPGARIATKHGERRRLSLPDGSLLSVNENTSVHHDAPRHLALKAGEIFVEVEPRRANKTASTFTVATPHREVRAAGTKFLVRADTVGTGVAVTQGQVHVSDWDGLLCAGQQLAPSADAITPMPRLSYLLAWTRDLVAEAAPSLVPPSAHAGGALVAVDSQGRAAHLSLRRYHIDVHIEDGFARTTIDQTYFNHTLGRLEGTFYFPLPPDASLSRLAMYVDGQRMEGGMVERDYGCTVFDQIVTKMKDPALLEWVDGRTFKMRVFPLEPRQEKRLILSYTQRLPNLYGRWSYRFPAGHSLGIVRDWSFHARVKNGKRMAWHCPSHALTPHFDKGDLVLDANAKQAALERDVALDLTESRGSKAARFSTTIQDGQRYLMLRYRPNLPGTATRQRRDWVFLFESSAERNPLLARTQVEIIRTLLANAEHDDTFAILTAGSQLHSFAASPQRVTLENVAAALSFLEKSPLLGALDLDAALKASAELLNRGEHPVLVHLGCGQAVLGERRPEVLTSRIPPSACYVGVGVGKRGASAFMRRAADQCQGYVTEINPDDAVAWRAFDLLAALNTPHLTDVRVEDRKARTQFLLSTSLLSQGEELCAIARLPVDAPLPQSICVTGLLDGRPFREEIPVDSPSFDAAYLPRTWARLEIDRLLAEDAVKNKNAIIALSKAMYVMTPYTSLLVLENEAMYAQYKVDRGRKDHWAMYPCPERIKVVSEWPEQSESDLLMWQERATWSERMSRPGRQYVAVSQSDGAPYTIQLEAPRIIRAASSVDSDAQLQERIRRENGERKNEPTQWMNNPYQGYLSAAADVTHLQSERNRGIPRAQLTYQDSIDRERAGLSGLAVEDVRRALNLIEEMEWERAQVPDPAKIRQAFLERELSRARNRPPLNEVWSAAAINVLLRHLIALDKQGVRGPKIPLREDTLHHLNLTISEGGGGIGLFKDHGKLEWPNILLREEFNQERDKMNKLLKSAYQSLRSNKNVEETALKAMQISCRKMVDTLNDEFIDKLTPVEYIEVRRYLQDVRKSIEALKNPQSVRLFSGVLKVKAGTVAELVRFMDAEHVWFAPAMPGDEAAYVSLYHCLLAFDRGLQRIETPAVRRSEDARLDGKSDVEEADRLLSTLLADPTKAKQASLWRQAARLAERRKQYDSALERLRRALELEANPRRDLLALRSDYSWFLNLAQQRVHELTSQQRSVPRELIEGVTAIADLWRSVDAEDWRPCWLAGRILNVAGQRELAWAYLTSPTFLQYGEAANWHELARQQHGHGEYDFAERAFAVASSLAPSNAEIVWERAFNHRVAGRRDAARTLLEQLDKGTWSEKYRRFQFQARRALAEERD